MKKVFSSNFYVENEKIVTKEGQRFSFVRINVWKICPRVKFVQLWFICVMETLRGVCGPLITPEFITLTYCRADYLGTETRKTTLKHSSFFKPEELPGALSQNRGLERKASSLPADELMLLEAKRLQTLNWRPAIRETRTLLRAGHPNEACKQNMGDNFTSLVLDSCCISMSRRLQRRQAVHSCEAAHFPPQGTLQSSSHLFLSFSSRPNCCCLSSKAKVK